MKESLDNIKSHVDRLAAMINVPAYLLPTYGNATESHPNIDVYDKGELCFEIQERGEIVLREYPLDLDYLLYCVFRHITKEMATQICMVHNENTDVDHRRERDEMQLSLLETLDKKWVAREREWQQNNLILFPYQDQKGRREMYTRELMGNGFFRDEAEKKAKERYP
jgi:hypothetical protein